jgi:hypothetical protein
VLVLSKPWRVLHALALIYAVTLEPQDRMLSLVALLSQARHTY